MEYELLDLVLLLFMGVVAAVPLVGALRGLTWRPVEATILSAGIGSEDVHRPGRRVTRCGPTASSSRCSAPFG